MCVLTTQRYHCGSPCARTLRKQCSKRQRGISTIEFALVSPIVFTVIFAIMFFGHIYSARVSLTTAVGSVRTGFTRGELSVFFPGLETIPDIGDFKETGGNPHTPPPHLRELLASPDQNGVGSGQAFGAGGTYATMLQDVYGSSPLPKLEDLSETKLYTLVFVNQMMAQSVGPSLRFPCEERGCLYCKFLPDPDAPTDPNTNYTGIECSYRPSSVFLDPLLSLLSLASGGTVDSNIVLTRTRVFDPR